ncbi:hypothetical protein RclHR1_07950005 [Rhizophagus clarus]|uniref:Uncharacterized protein n=1 Tax=Rhizophagus clarus TaxID=94130 RepID=A0A2Z6RYN4_9GLOM|nr:hypothetical protein RclHR1_07950005 [Rhizophagus clarus]
MKAVHGFWLHLKIQKKQTMVFQSSERQVSFRFHFEGLKFHFEVDQNPDKAQIYLKMFNFKGLTLFEGLELHPEAIEYFKDQQLIDEFSDKIQRFATSRCLLDVISHNSEGTQLLESSLEQNFKSFDFHSLPKLNFKGSQISWCFFNKILKVHDFLDAYYRFAAAGYSLAEF